MPKKYVPSRRNKHTSLRKRLFESLQRKEHYHKHYIPPKAVGRTMKKLDLKPEYEGNFYARKNGGFPNYGSKDVYALKDKKGVKHAQVAFNRRTKKVDWWFVK